MSAYPSDRPMPGTAPYGVVPRRRWSLRIRWPGSHGRAALGRCPVCHGRVQPDDALGLMGSRVAHAECALVSWLGPGRLSRELL
ncbi:MAG TPA: hypothetical protein VHY83_12825 [Solirubrobacteraceae bacterium]|jgi:hypothetical protein|nr:hypothetical protein [Solirubrobacteraceae bacterium]